MMHTWYHNYWLGWLWDLGDQCLLIMKPKKCAVNISAAGGLQLSRDMRLITLNCTHVSKSAHLAEVSLRVQLRRINYLQQRFSQTYATDTLSREQLVYLVLLNLTLRAAFLDISVLSVGKMYHCHNTTRCSDHILQVWVVYIVCSHICPQQIQVVSLHSDKFQEHCT